MTDDLSNQSLFNDRYEALMHILIMSVNKMLDKFFN
jgi:hypothetical protein